jgi:hypothetical protein
VEAKKLQEYLDWTESCFSLAQQLHAQGKPMTETIRILEATKNCTLDFARYAASGAYVPLFIPRNRKPTGTSG